MYYRLRIVRLLTLGSILTLLSAHGSHAVDWKYRFATIDEAQDVLKSDDAFTGRLTKFDVQSRLKNADLTMASDYQSAVAKSAAPWQSDLRQKVQAAAAQLAQQLRPYDIPVPKETLLVCTTGEAEAGAAHTRGNAIILPISRIRSQRKLSTLLAHELFHILSRQNPSWRDQMYATIGYQRCNEIKLSGELEPLRITNPDAPIVQHYIEVQIGDRKVPVTQMLIANVDAYRPTPPRPFFHFLKTLFIELQREGDSMIPIFDEDGGLLSHPKSDLGGFYNQIGRNTEYLIHPEEILADNFSFLVTGEGGKKSPEVLKKLKALMTKSQ